MLFISPSQYSQVPNKREGVLIVDGRRVWKISEIETGGRQLTGGEGFEKFFLFSKSCISFIQKHMKKTKKVTTEIQKGHLEAKNCKMNILEINKRGVLINIAMVDKKLKI